MDYIYLCYGIRFDRKYCFPWGYDIKEWWMKVNNYHPIHDPFDIYGNFNPGWSNSDPRFIEYYAQEEEWLEKNPLPITVISNEAYYNGIIVLALINKCYRTDAGDHLGINPLDLTISKDQTDILLNFINNYDLKPSDPTPKWWLISF